MSNPSALDLANHVKLKMLKPINTQVYLDLAKYIRANQTNQS